MAFPGLAGALLLATLSWAIWSGASAQVDQQILLAFRTPGEVAKPLGPAWVAETGRDVTGLGSNGVMALIVITAGGGFLIAARWRGALTLALAFMSAECACAALKVVAQRTRPDLIPDTPRVFTTSFPSSHAMVSASTLLALAAVAADWAPNPGVRRFGFAMALLGTGMIGVSRVYLGVHWPSDVAAGWVAGLVCFWASRVGVAVCCPAPAPPPTSSAPGPAP